MECKICNKKFKSYRGLSIHLNLHDISKKDYYDEFISLTNIHLCVDCDIDTKFIRINEGYDIRCNNCKVIYNKKQNSKRMKQLHVDGKMILWNQIDNQEKIDRYKDIANKISKTLKGRTKEDYDYLQKFSENRKGDKNPRHKRSDVDWQKTYKKLSEIMKEKIKNGEFTPCITNSWANSRAKISINGTDKSYRSTWEAVFQILNPTLLFEKIRIPYISPKDNKEHIYIIDFVDEENKLLYEIKPKSQINDVTLAKEKYAVEWSLVNGYQYIIISDDWFKENANKIDYNLYNEKIKNGMKQFL